ncbi:DNA topoisomerase I-interacting protein [Aspergillus campestris IBT 28561]|uniref:Topoisomerase 1-associated factor 1 n=1 Tax=Aspergillus campestris (strain IBT 28561) TaxID=1392248 RepID=A0A2I1CQM9_ASPC2|nr:DNA topoisomerase I-interacting protein [Aspergillus campestris IBT 28561]PKX99931.1 DNA topoisomerase I-interacting protein [Aspergillus campestris IBT 28561]
MDETAFGEGVEPVDLEVRAHVYSLVTALGGFNGEDADKYVLGDDALACLRDIKRWLRLYDQKNNRMDVARCLGEANVVNGDLLPILAAWSENERKSKHLFRIAMACLELLVPLTWPLEIHGETTVNHHRHIPYLQQAQVSYKRRFLSHSSLDLLRTVIRIGLPSMAIPRSERTGRDEGILRIMLYFFRNVAVITPNARLAAEGEEEETSRSATINAFQDQDVFALLLTMCSNITDDFNMFDVILLETLFHIVKGVNVDKLFMNDSQRTAKRTDELDGLLRKEDSLRKEYAKGAPTRHGRFGTMIWVKRDDAKVSTVSGQTVLKDGQTTLHKMDQSKKWNKPQPRRRQDHPSIKNDFSTPVHLNSEASENLRKFVEEFLDSGFNPLFTNIRKAIEREADRVLDENSLHYFYTVSWFLEAERTRRLRKRQRRSQAGKPKETEPDSFGLVASVLNQETFVFLNRSMQWSFDNKDWEGLNAEMRCFTQILLTVQEMALSPLDEDQEIAENIQNRIFYEGTTHDRMAAIMHRYKDQGFGYLDACTELCHVFLRMLERYSKENADMQVKAKQRTRRKNKQAEATGDENNEEDNASEEEDHAEAERVSKERKFDYRKFEQKFCTQACVDTFVSFTKYYGELTEEQLKRAHRYFYRVAFKNEKSVLLFRVDIMNLFYRMIKGPGAMDSSQPIFKEWEELVRQIIRRLMKKLEQRPALITEMLFSKINSTASYLEYGHERQTVSTAKKSTVELEVDPKEGSTLERKIAIVVAAMVKDDQSALVRWVSDVQGSAAEEREAWEAQETARRDEDPTVANTSNPPIGMYLSTSNLGTTHVDKPSNPTPSYNDPRPRWEIPSTMNSKEIGEIKSIVDQNLASPIAEDTDPRELLRRKFNHEGNKSGGLQTTLDVNFGSESEGEEVPDGPLFPPNPRSKASALDELKKKRKKRSKENQDEVDEAVLEERRKVRSEATRERIAKIKSDLFVHASDEESDEDGDEEFFRLEEQRRKAQSERIKKALLTGRVEGEDSAGLKGRGGRKRQSDVSKSKNTTSQSKRQRRKNPIAESDDDDTVMVDDDVLASALPQTTTDNEMEDRASTPPRSMDDDLNFDDDLAFSRDHERNRGLSDLESPDPTRPDASAEAGNDEDEEVPVAAPSRRRMRAGFVIDSDSE